MFRPTPAVTGHLFWIFPFLFFFSFSFCRPDNPLPLRPSGTHHPLLPTMTATTDPVRGRG
ncbi:hypothetical protein BO99DRAFT_401460 [Aspergillus violaceofuscus CBS 115571]|uniref:Uncharacterized protein n=1 Tax=Aspergillus violaceofuscus (strain CBS 115571) TaxID=1450538 RepID=A0A2V5H9G1_ASPV1|nr:hypothetical protein BO99DRAFT_401460 [Aspergillus violaceofuscus CBS 115571]